MHRWLMLSLGLVGGCVVYDEQLVYEDDPQQPPPVETDIPVDDDPSDDTMAWFSPNQGALGTHALVRLEGDLDLSELSDIKFFGPSGVTLHGLFQDETGWFVSLDVGLPACDGTGAGVAGANDAFIEFSDGFAIYLPDAFLVQ
jgi:hypothetical protein